MHHNSKQLQQLQADLAAVHAEILKLQSYNKRMLSYGNNLLQSCQPQTSLPSPSGRTTSPAVSSLPHGPPTLSWNFS
jgi:hypothetical protein